MSLVEKLVPYELVDIGANLGHSIYDKDMDEVLLRAKQAGITKIMITGTCEKVSQQIVSLAETWKGFLYFTAGSLNITNIEKFPIPQGVHPYNAKDFNDGTLKVLKNLLNHSQSVAVGECGLDFNKNFSPQDMQLEVFRKQVALACELKKPLFLHEREAHSHMVDILEEYKENLPPSVVHCFTGTAVEAKKYVEMGLHIGLTGFLWKDKSADGVRFALQSGSIPLDRLVIETDAPFMYPKINDRKLPLEVRRAITEPAKQLHKFSSSNRNDPSSLPSICEMIAAFLGETPEKVALVTTENSKRIFSLY